MPELPPDNDPTDRDKAGSNLRPHIRPALTLVPGCGGRDAAVDWVTLLEEMDLRDALPILQCMGRQRKAAANQALALVPKASAFELGAPSGPADGLQDPASCNQR